MKKTANKLPEITKQPIIYVDSTPDSGYVLRILKAYRDNCDCKWATSCDGECDNLLLKTMNEHQDQRAKLLDEAIDKLIGYASQNDLPIYSRKDMESYAFKAWMAGEDNGRKNLTPNGLLDIEGSKRHFKERFLKENKLK
jgi:hypothetical protein